MGELVIGSYRDSFPLWPQYLKLKDDESNVHVHLAGVSGMGKSKLLASMFVQRIRAGQAASLVDIHSDLANEALAMLISMGFFNRSDAFDRLLFVEFEHEDSYNPFGILDQPHLSPDVISDDIIESFHRAFPELATGAAQFDTLVSNSVEVLVRRGSSLPALFPLILNEEFRRKMLEGIDNYGIHAYFSNFDRLKDSEQSNQSMSTIRRINLLTRSPLMEYSLGCTDNPFLNFRQILDNGQSVIYDLGKPQNHSAARLLGCLITVGMERAAYSRKQSSNRRAHHLMIDEFGEFAAQSSDALASMLSGTRKFGLFVTMSHQTLGQLSGKLSGGALHNVGLKIAMRLGRKDAEELAKEYGATDPMAIKHEADRGHPVYLGLAEQWESWINSLTSLPKRHALVKAGDRPAVMVKTMDVPTPNVTPSQIEEVKAEYRRRLMRHKSQIVLPYQIPVEEEPIIGRTAPRR